jgi:LytS/YehU family sensor histidine kinase
VVVDYLEIERSRFGDRLAYEIDVPDEARALPLPAFAVQTLVENCVKHAVSAREAGATITVRGRRARGRLRVEVSDDGPGFGGSPWIAGHGLDGLRNRLDVLYGDAATLAVAGGPAAGATVTLDVPGAP